MKVSVIEARAKRNKLDELAGSNYCDNSSKIVSSLNKRRKNAYLGIQSDDGLYTIIGEKYIYLLTKSGTEIEIPHSSFLEILQRNGMSIGKSGEFEFVPSDENESIWVKDGPTMCALWNIVLLLSRDERK